ncbi:hypothetical protein [Streptomyces jumonjinensis]|uniref:hypothetical protein n=1 Tax=Streptomyces jumonjinensis TaxID=1945 RepID=UPI003791B0CF
MTTQDPLMWALQQMAEPTAGSARQGQEIAEDAYQRGEEYPGLSALLATASRVQQQAEEREVSNRQESTTSKHRNRATPRNAYLNAWKADK